MSGIDGAIGALGGVRVIESTALPIAPSPGTVGRRIVRHGMADVLAWLGESVGPGPEDATEALIIGRDLFASVALVGRMADTLADTPP